MADQIDLRSQSLPVRIKQGFYSGLKGGAVGGITWGLSAALLSLAFESPATWDPSVCSAPIFGMLPGAIIGSLLGGMTLFLMYYVYPLSTKKQIHRLGPILGMLCGAFITALLGHVLLESYAAVPSGITGGFVGGLLAARMCVKAADHRAQSITINKTHQHDHSNTLSSGWQQLFTSLTILLIPATLTNCSILLTAIGLSTRPVLSFWLWPQYALLFSMIFFPIAYLVGVTTHWFHSWRKWALAGFALIPIAITTLFIFG